MIGILLEVFGGDIPEFLHPVKAVVLPVSESAQEYAKIFRDKLAKKEGYKPHECLINQDNLPLSKRIALASSELIPNIYVVGEKEFISYQESGIAKGMIRKDGKNQQIELS